MRPAAVLGAWLLLATGAAAQSTAATPGPVAALSSTARATQLFEQAVVDYGAGRHAQALSGFREAYRLRPHPMVRVNMANCYDKLGEPVQAIFHFERFLEAKAGTAAQRREVSTALRRLRNAIGEVSLRIAPGSATVVIDGTERRRRPSSKPLTLRAGAHWLEVRLRGYQTVRRRFEVKPKGVSQQSVTLQPSQLTVAAPPDAAASAWPVGASRSGPATVDASSVPPLAQPTRAPVVDGTRDWPAKLWIAGGLSAALLIAGTLTGVLALDAEADFDRNAAAASSEATPLRRLSAYNAAADAARRAEALALATDILVAGGLLGVGVTAFVAVTYAREGQQAGLQPQLGTDGARLVLSGSY